MGWRTTLSGGIWPVRAMGAAWVGRVDEVGDVAWEGAGGAKMPARRGGGDVESGLVARRICARKLSQNPRGDLVVGFLLSAQY
ncbi:hypothetical protein BJ912DRAFT_995187 [Pholiota molesta]|nr:hypothetical protein BJ912DRAFT_995187 [Pholiota molesta]